MGYRHKPKLIEVKLDGEYDGFEATFQGSDLAGFLAVQGIGDVDESELAAQIRRMSESLISWNLETEDGTPVPATPDSVYAGDQELMLAVAAAWFEALAGIKAPLEPSSTDGEQSLEASLPMAPLSESLAS